MTISVLMHAFLEEHGKACVIADLPFPVREGDTVLVDGKKYRIASEQINWRCFDSAHAHWDGEVQAECVRE